MASNARNVMQSRVRPACRFGVVAVLFVALLTGAASPAASREPLDHQRIAGADRYETAARLAVRGVDPGSVSR